MTIVVEVVLLPSDHEMDQCDKSSFEFSTSTSVDGGRWESFPDDWLTDVSSNEKRNACIEWWWWWWC